MEQVVREYGDFGDDADIRSFSPLHSYSSINHFLASNWSCSRRFRWQSFMDLVCFLHFGRVSTTNFSFFFFFFGRMNIPKCLCIIEEYYSQAANS